MTGQNVGILERGIRLLLALAIGAWVYRQPEIGFLEGLAMLAATFLVLNAIVGRCYLWLFLNINTCEERRGVCERGPKGDLVGKDGQSTR